VDAITDAKKLLFKTEKRSEKNEETVGTALATPPVVAGPSNPVDLRSDPNDGGILTAGDINTGSALREHNGQRQQAQVATAPPPRQFTVFSGDRRHDPDEGSEGARRLSSSAAIRISDISAALAGPLAGAIVARSVAVFAVATLVVMLARARARRVALAEGEISGIGPVAAAAAVFVTALNSPISAGVDVRHALFAALAALAAGGIAAIILKFISDRLVHTRIAVIGSAAHAHELAWELADTGNRRYSVVGYVNRSGQKENLRELQHVSFKVRKLGVLADLSHIVARNDVDMLVLADDSDRLETFERASVCAERYQTRLVGLGSFNEIVFQRVPIEGLNSAWLQHIMHPRYRPAPRAAIRVLDVVGAVLLGALTLPLWLAAVIAIKLEDGGPVFYRQRRVGERGRAFTIIKFRSMRTDAEANGALWSSGDDDDRITKTGRWSRRFHVDELPQLINVMRGDMSLVGPRPERPEFVTKLEQDIPFYSRRHLVKPGITGWAQVRAGYGKSDEGAVIKLSRDLFYLKHQSLFLYTFTLLATCWTVTTGTVHSKAQ
jgi:exopolysaccharide biosynthesis polyprenyl glycosylphosphotransferase